LTSVLASPEERLSRNLRSPYGRRSRCYPARIHSGKERPEPNHYVFCVLVRANNPRSLYFRRRPHYRDSSACCQYTILELASELNVSTGTRRTTEKVSSIKSLILYDAQRRLQRSRLAFEILSIGNLLRRNRLATEMGIGLCELGMITAGIYFTGRELPFVGNK
jgi:hypothetical protein